MKQYLVFLSVIRKDGVITTCSHIERVNENKTLTNEDYESFIRSVIYNKKTEKNWIGGKIEKAHIRDFETNKVVYEGGSIFNEYLKS